MKGIGMLVRHRIIIILLAFVSIASGCSHVDRIVIDGDSAAMMENIINEQMADSDYLRRGNSASNMRNGGYVISDGETIMFITDMKFSDGSVVRYLQRLSLEQIGSLTARNDIEAALDGTLVGLFHGFIIFIDNQTHLMMAYDPKAYTHIELFEEPVDMALSLDDTIYATTKTQHNLWQVELVIDLADRLVGEPTLLAESAGVLAGITHDFAYVIPPNSKEMLDTIDLDTGKSISRIMGGPYEDMQISGSWLYYHNGDRLMRQPLTGESPQIAITRTVDEYVVWGPYLAFSETDGGLFVSQLDGTGVVKLSDDIASGLQFTDGRLYYRNGYDGSDIYVIDMMEGKRSALLGPTMTDGGIHFSALDANVAKVFEEYYGTWIAEIADERSMNEHYSDSLHEPVLFIEIDADGKPVAFHRLTTESFSPEEVKAVVVISPEFTILGRYTDGSLAYRHDTVLTLFHPGEQKAYLSWVVEGRPPSEIKSGEGDRFGLPISWHQKALDLIELIRSHQ